MQFPHFILHFYYPNGLFYQENLGQPIWIRLHIFVVSFAINCDYHYTHATCKKFKCLNAFSVFASKMQLILGALRMGQLTVTFSYKHTVLVQRHSKSSHSASQERIDERLCSVCVCVLLLRAAYLMKNFKWDDRENWFCGRKAISSIFRDLKVKRNLIPCGFLTCAKGAHWTSNLLLNKWHLYK